MLIFLALLLGPPSSGLRNDAGQVVQEGKTLAAEPVRDVGAAHITIPQVLEDARAAPYGAPAPATCGGIAGAIADLTEALGPDIDTPSEAHRNSAGRLAKEGGQAVVDSVIPFRGLVREASGAAAAQRRLNEAINAGFARRGYLHGLATAKGCRPKS